MRLRMLTALGGVGFSLKRGDETEQFDDKEAKRLIAAGYAEKAPPPVARKPATKAEWDAERDALLAENAALKAENEKLIEDAGAAKERTDALEAIVGGVAALMSKPLETTSAPAAPEQRG